MPIYEFACRRCRTVFSFLFKSAGRVRSPKCPKCGRGGLTRRFSRFSVGSGAKPSAAPAGEAGAGDFDDARFEQAMLRLEREMGSIDENDPRQMGRFMRRMMEETGQPIDGDLETAIRRLEAGEDPERVEEEMGDVLEGAAGGAGDWSVDENLYDG